MKTMGFFSIVSATMALAADTGPLHQRQARVSPAWITDGVIYQMWLGAFVRSSDEPLKVTINGAEGGFEPMLTEGAAGDALAGFRMSAYGYWVGKQ